MKHSYYVCLMTAIHSLIQVLKKNKEIFHPIVPFDPAEERIVSLDLTSANAALTEDIINSTDLFSAYIQNHLSAHRARYAVGGYGELRTMYSRSQVFDSTQPHEEPRRFHLGVDIWGDEGTTVFCPLGGMVHSVAMNPADGDYGATIVLLHQLEGISFYTLYGHLSESDLAISPGAYITHGQVLAHFGKAGENGNWPPHLHFQVIMDMELKEGDYPGVCRFSEKEKYLDNCPDPDLIINMNQFIS